MELKKIKDLMSAMGRTGMKKIRIKDKDFEIELEKESKKNDGAQTIEGSTSATVTTVKTKHGDIPPSLHPPVESAPSPVDNGQYVTSPMVGTFYTASGPDEPPFIKVGDKVSKDSVVCIIEAMKVMNEVKAGVDGKVVEVLVDNGHPVEFGTKLYKLS